MKRTLRQNVVREITYRCELYKDIEEGTIVGYWTGERDTWGKFTFRVIDVLDGGEYIESLPATMYLFAQEILTIEAPSYGE